VAVNDSRTPWAVSTTVSRRNLAGDVLASAVLEATVLPGENATLPLPADLTTAGDPTTEFLTTDTGTTWFWSLDKDIPWPPAAYRTDVKRDGDTTTVTVQAQSLLRSLTLFPDRLDPSAEPDRSGVTVLPGHSVTFTVQSRHPLDPDALTSPPVLRCVNDLLQPR
jgi:beta-mannosidase